MSLNISLTEKWLNSANIKIKNENDFQSNPINAFYFNYSLAADNSSKNKLRGNFDTVYASNK